MDHDKFATQVAKEIEEKIPRDLTRGLRRTIVGVVKKQTKKLIYSKPHKYTLVSEMSTRVNNVRVSDEERELLNEARKLIFKSESVPYGEVIEYLAKRYITEQATDSRDMFDADYHE